MILKPLRLDKSYSLGKGTLSGYAAGSASILQVERGGC